MARYRDAVQWIAANDGASDTKDLAYPDALTLVSEQVTVVMVADIFGRSERKVGADVLRARGVRKPRGWRELPPDPVLPGASRNGD
jgi:hypothetical protein